MYLFKVQILKKLILSKLQIAKNQNLEQIILQSHYHLFLIPTMLPAALVRYYEKI